MPTPSIVPKILPMLEEYLEKLDVLWESQSMHPREPTLPITNDGKVNVRAITLALWPNKQSMEQHFYKHKELADAVNVLCRVQGVKFIGSRAMDEEHDQIVHDRLSRVSKQANDLARQSAEREALLQAYRRENEKLREQLRMLEQSGMLLRQQVIQ